MAAHISQPHGDEIYSLQVKKNRQMRMDVYVSFLSSLQYD